jgi:hypothetical protein
VLPKAITVDATIARWEAWTGMLFAASGSYEVPGALVPVRIDREAGRGRYEEPNVWMLHKVPRTVHVMGSWGPRETEERG